MRAGVALKVRRERGYDPAPMDRIGSKRTDGLKRCRFCAEPNPEAAVVCRYCKRPLTPAQAPASQAPASLPRPQSGSRLASFALLGVVALLSVFLAVSQRTDPTATVNLRAMSEASLVATPGATGIALSNESDVTTWSRCSVEIDGGYFSPKPFTLPAHGKRMVPFSDFTTASGQRLSAGQGYDRALKKVELECADAAGSMWTLTPR